MDRSVTGSKNAHFYKMPQVVLIKESLRYLPLKGVLKHYSEGLKLISALKLPVKTILSI